MIQTTVVGSYPVPARWLRIYNTRESLRDAMMVVLKTQELAGIDVVADGELYRFDINHPETNGMIDYFVRPLAGRPGRADRDRAGAFRAEAGMSLPHAAGRDRHGSDSAEGRSTCRATMRSPRPDAEPEKFTVTSPTCWPRPCTTGITGTAAPWRWPWPMSSRPATRGDRRGGGPGRRGQRDRPPGRWPDWAAGINRVLDGVPRAGGAVHLCFGNYGGQTIQRGTWRNSMPFLNALEADHLVLELARRPEDELDVFRELKAGDRARDRRDRHQGQRGRDAGRGGPADRACGPLSGSRADRFVHPDCGLWMLPRSVADAKMRASSPAATFRPWRRGLIRR